MTLILLVFLGGALTIASPCILPVLPFVFARAEQPFLRNGLPMLIGMALTFAAVATLAPVGGAWAAHLNQYGRIEALLDGKAPADDQGADIDAKGDGLSILFWVRRHP
jgi:cytochrome c biogenesis protein CcdA